FRARPRPRPRRRTGVPRC
ncbi:hypothetical protein NJB1728f10_09650, partial [Mycobacterium marinum]